MFVRQLLQHFKSRMMSRWRFLWFDCHSLQSKATTFHGNKRLSFSVTAGCLTLDQAEETQESGVPSAPPRGQLQTSVALLVWSDHLKYQCHQQAWIPVCQAAGAQQSSPDEGHHPRAPGGGLPVTSRHQTLGRAPRSHPLLQHYRRPQRCHSQSSCSHSCRFQRAQQLR